MPLFQHGYLYDVAYHIYRAEGVTEEEARTVATHQVKANLTGHDSHGVIHIPEYVERIHRGTSYRARPLRWYGSCPPPPGLTETGGSASW